MFLPGSDGKKALVVVTICFRYRFSVFFRYCFCIDILGATAESFARSTRGSGMVCAISYRDFVGCVRTVIVSGAGVIHGSWRSFALSILESSTVYKMLTFWLTHLFLDYVRTTIASSEC
jgi:hypothetical protein